MLGADVGPPDTQQRGSAEMIIDCAHYQDGRPRAGRPASLAEAAARCGQGGFVWLGLFEPDLPELAQVRDIFGLHELAVEDAQNFHMRPKVEPYDGDVRLVILRTARYDDVAEEVEFGEYQRLPRADLRDHGAAGRGQPAARRQAAAGAEAGTAGRRQHLSAVGRPGHGRGRIRARRGGARARHRPDRGDRIFRRGRADRADLLAAPRGH